MTALPLPELASQTSMVLRMRHLLEVSSPFIFLSGASGSGKSLLCESLLSTIERPWLIAYLDYQDSFSVSRVRELLVHSCFPGSVFDPEDPLPDTFLRLLGHSPRHLLIALDSVEKLPVEFVAELWELICINDALPQAHHLAVILCGGSLWAEKQARGLKGRETPPIELEVEPLPVREQMELFDFYLRSASFSAKLPNAQAVADKLRGCEGNPGKIIELAEIIMERNSKSPLKGREIPLNKVLATAAVIAGVTLLLSWLLPPLLQKEKVTPEVAKELQPAAPSTALNTTAVTPVVEDSGALPSAAQGNLTVKDEKNLENRRVVIADKVVKQIIASQKEGKVVAASSAATSVAGAASGAAVTSVEQLSGVASELKGTTVEKKAKPAPEEKASATSAKSVKAVPAKPAPQPEAHLLKDSGAADLAEIRTKTARHYTLQLSAGADKGALQAYARQLTLSEQSWIYQTEYKGKPWFVLIQGDYASAALAKAAIASLPALAKKGPPWPKSFGQVQKEMK